ncbi:MAG: hypothetical protein ACRD4S_06505 [Candidatus Acidiferrales bacterium]
MPTEPSQKKEPEATRHSIERPVQHPIRIVPLHRPEAPGRAAGAAPNLTYRNGPLLTAVQVFTVFWGAAWQQSPSSDVMAKINQFFDYILTSQLIDQMREYNVLGKTIGHGSRIGTAVVTSPDPGTSVQDSAIQKLIQSEISAGTLPGTNSNSLYFVFLPQGVQVVQGNTASCQSFCGYHDSFGKNVYYAVMPYPGCAGCTGGLAAFDALTSTTSHELCESITDPVPGQGWYDDNNGEIGDICAWKTRTLGAYTVQLEWSNKAGACM